MMYVGLISKAESHPGMELEKYCKQWKNPLFLSAGNNVFAYGGLYIVERKIDKKQTNLLLFLTCFMIMALTFHEHWPKWL